MEAENVAPLVIQEAKKGLNFWLVIKILLLILSGGIIVILVFVIAKNFKTWWSSFKSKFNSSLDTFKNTFNSSLDTSAVSGGMLEAITSPATRLASIGRQLVPKSMEKQVMQPAIFKIPDPKILKNRKTPQSILKIPKTPKPALKPPKIPKVRVKVPKIPGWK